MKHSEGVAQLLTKSLEDVLVDAAQKGMDVHVGPLRVADSAPDFDRFSLTTRVEQDYRLTEPGSTATPPGWFTYRCSLFKNHPIVLGHIEKRMAS